MSQADDPRTTLDDLAAVAREIIDTNQYMTIATADTGGTPWATPVWCLHASYREFIWVSRLDARHSRNIAARSEVAIVIFDSTVPAGTGQAVYLEGKAAQVGDVERASAVEIFSARSVAAGAPAWTLEAVTARAEHRLYRAIAAAHHVVDAHDHRLPVKVAGERDTERGPG